ncbi:unnamed protein product [Adineta steineri]|uniref:Uncharacterized protein n=1 Tax=Adineta steineri TaxID=433720 RepID=A0A815V2N4_9BILA|nr:unnamed protein product [Adineta steineri]
MIFINYIYYSCILLLFHINYIWAYECLLCATKLFNYSITTDDLPTPTEDDCNIIRGNHGCHIHIDWLHDGTSEVHYQIGPALPDNKILSGIERQVIINTGKYSTRKLVSYSCTSTKTACNTIDRLKHAINSIAFPTNEQIEQFDTLIRPTKNFNASLCAQVSNTTHCPKLNLTDCQQCISIVQYSESTNTCRTCTNEEIQRNYFLYSTTFDIDSKNQSEEIRIGCRNGYMCSLLVDTERIKQILVTKFNFTTFNTSIATTTKSTNILFCIIICIQLLLK